MNKLSTNAIILIIIVLLVLFCACAACFFTLTGGALLSRRMLLEIGVNRTGGKLPDGSDSQYMGYLCYSKQPVQTFSTASRPTPSGSSSAPGEAG